MEYVLAILLVLAAWFYIYQSVLLPTIHASLRNKLFALRDDLRNYAFDRGNEIDSRAYDIAHTGINNAINSVRTLDLSMQLKMQRLMAQDAGLRREIERRAKVVENSDDERIQEIVKQASLVLRDIFFFNAGGWFIFVVPIAVGVAFYRSITRMTAEFFSMKGADADMLLGLKTATC